MKGKYIDMQKHISRNKELVLIYADYQKSLNFSRFYDYGDMIMQAMLVLEKNNDLLLTLQEQYLYILVDGFLFHIILNNGKLSKKYN